MRTVGLDPRRLGLLAVLLGCAGGMLAAGAMAGRPEATAERVPAPPSGVAAALQASPYRYEASWPLEPEKPWPPVPSEPVDVALDRAGRLYVADWANRIVRVLGPDGTAETSWALGGRMADDDNSLARPRAVDVRSDGSAIHVLWAVQAPDWLGNGTPVTHEIVSYDAQGRLVDRLHLGETGLVDLALHDETGDLFVVSAVQLSRVGADGALAPVCAQGVRGGRLAVLSGGQVALPHWRTRTLDICAGTGGLLRTVDTGSRQPVALAADGSGGLHVLAFGPGEGGAPGTWLVRYDETLAPIAETALAALGVPDPAHVDPELAIWPWAIDVEGPRRALLSADEGLGVFVLGGDAPLRALSGRSWDGAGPRANPVVATSGAVSLVATDRGLFALDSLHGRVLALEQGGATPLAWAAGAPVDLAVGADGALFVSTAADVVGRFEPTGSVTPTWSVPCACAFGGRLTAMGSSVYVTRPGESAVARLDLATRRLAPAFTLPEASGLWPADIQAVETDTVGLATADPLDRQVQLWREGGARADAWVSGLEGGPRRLGFGRTPDGMPAIAALTVDGFVELHAAADGALLARWPARLPDGAQPPATDIALGGDGRVFLADPSARKVHVFAPGPGPIPTPEPPEPTATPSERSCTVRGDKLAGPRRVVLGETAAVTLTLQADCPPNATVRGADIMVVFASAGRSPDASTEGARRPIRELVTLLDLRHHRVGLYAGLPGPTPAVLPLSHDAGALLAFLARDDLGFGPYLQREVPQALAMLETERRADALPVLLVLVPAEGRPPDASAMAAADAARDRGVQVYVIALGPLEDRLARERLGLLAGRPDRLLVSPDAADLYALSQELVRIVRSSLAGNVVVTDEMGAFIDYVPRSSRPEALVSADRLEWGQPLLPVSGVTFTYRILPLDIGVLPTNREAVAHYTDADGARRSHVFPIPDIEVIAPTATPTPTPAPTATARPPRVYLPILSRRHCVPMAGRADVVLVLDTSTSMSEPDGAKIEAAKRAAATFVGLLDLPRDRAAVIGFDRAARVATGLTGDRETLLRAIEGLETDAGTRIDLGLWAAVDALEEGNPRANRPVVVLLSDGVHGGDPGDLWPARDAIRALGSLLFAIGLGADADRSTLAGIADPGRHHFAPGAADLEAIYRAIAATIPCR